MLYYLALCAGLIYAQIISLPLAKAISIIFFTISLLAFIQFFKSITSKPKIYVILTTLSLFMLSFAYSTIRSNIRVQNQITEPISKISTAGYIISPIKQFESSNQAIIKITQGSLTGKNISLTFEKNIQLQAATNYQFMLNVYPTSTTNNIDNFDMKTYYLSNNIVGSGRLINYKYISKCYNVQALINKFRSGLIYYLAQTTSSLKYSGFFIALATGYQSYIPRDQWTIFQATGINHIVSISGLHLTLVTGFFAMLLMQVFKQIKPTKAPRQIWIALLSIIFASTYAVLSGLGIPIQRALYMLIISSYLITRRKYLPVLYQLIICLTLSLIIDPFAVFSIGFWFSYTLIAGLMVIITQRSADNKYKQAIRTQLTILMLGIPLSLYYFSKVSLISTISNLWAVPILGTIFTPLVLISAIIHIGFIIKLVTILLGYALLPIEWLSHISMYSQIKPNLAAVLLAYLGVGLFIIQIPIRHKNKFALLLFSAIFFIGNKTIANGTTKLTIFSSNTGGIVLIQTKQSNSLYINSESTNMAATLNNAIPHLKAQNINTLNYLISNNYTLAESILQSNQIKVISQLQDKIYQNGVYLIPTSDNSLLIQTRKEISYIGTCSTQNVAQSHINNIIIPNYTKKCNWLYQHQPQNLIINGNYKNQSKIDNLISNLHFNADKLQNISNDTSVELISK